VRQLQYNEALNEALIEEMTRDEKVILIGEDVGAYGGVFKVSKGLLDRFGPQRVRERRSASRRSSAPPRGPP
jgi:pyruvate dehydrogenase E1 component beta subunit